MDSLGGFWCKNEMNILVISMTHNDGNFLVFLINNLKKIPKRCIYMVSDSFCKTVWIQRRLQMDSDLEWAKEMYLDLCSVEDACRTISL